MIGRHVEIIVHRTKHRRTAVIYLFSRIDGVAIGFQLVNLRFLSRPGDHGKVEMPQGTSVAFARKAGVESTTESNIVDSGYRREVNAVVDGRWMLADRDGLSLTSLLH